MWPSKSPSFVKIPWTAEASGKSEKQNKQNQFPFPVDKVDEIKVCTGVIQQFDERNYLEHT